ncbi:MAG: hypothetical protein Fur0042_13760 [Cyanophyceae cyanobacterium]
MALGLLRFPGQKFLGGQGRLIGQGNHGNNLQGSVGTLKAVGTIAAVTPSKFRDHPTAPD